MRMGNDIMVQMSSKDTERLNGEPESNSRTQSGVSHKFRGTSSVRVSGIA